jgi:hypothetical protein
MRVRAVIVIDLHLRGSGVRYGAEADGDRSQSAQRHQREQR